MPSYNRTPSIVVNVNLNLQGEKYNPKDDPIKITMKFAKNHKKKRS